MHKIKSIEKPTATQTVFALIQLTIESRDKGTPCWLGSFEIYYVPIKPVWIPAWPGK
jgi:hypothetical protein